MRQLEVAVARRNRHHLARPVDRQRAEHERLDDGEKRLVAPPIAIQTRNSPRNPRVSRRCARVEAVLSGPPYGRTIGRNNRTIVPRSACDSRVTTPPDWRAKP